MNHKRNFNPNHSRENNRVQSKIIFFEKRNRKEAELLMKKNEHAESFRILTGGSVGEIYNKLIIREMN